MYDRPITQPCSSFSIGTHCAPTSRNIQDSHEGTRNEKKKNQSGISSIVGGHFSWSIHFSEQTVAVYDRRTTRVPRFPPTFTTIPPAVYRTAIKVRKIQKIGMEYRPLSAEVSIPPCAPTLRIPGWSLVTGHWLISRPPSWTSLMLVARDRQFQPEQFYPVLQQIFPSPPERQPSVSHREPRSWSRSANGAFFTTTPGL